MAARNRKAPLDEVPDGLVAAAVDRVRREGAVPLKSLAQVPLTRAAQAHFLDELGRAGLERTGKHARVPLREQLEALLAGGPVATKKLRQRLRGLASASELSHLIRTAVDAGWVRLAYRSGHEVVVPAGAPVVDADERRALDGMARELGRLLRGARKRDLLREDVAVLLAPFAGWVGAWLRQAIAERISAERPLVFVPELARALDGRLASDRLAEELLRGAAAGLWELRPESGVGLLSAEDAALCPRGFRGEVLSYVRLR